MVMMQHDALTWEQNLVLCSYADIKSIQYCGSVMKNYSSDRSSLMMIHGGRLDVSKDLGNEGEDSGF
jgi:hypothetical protein